jgi:hypothetical protein
MRTILSIFFLLVVGASYAQDEFFMDGCLPDDGTYNQLPRKAELLTRDYKSMPKVYSLKQYCPNVRSQGGHGSCTSWAAAYAARTIAEAVKYGWTDNEKITSEAFAPLFVYALIKDYKMYPRDVNCKKGTLVSHAVKLMKEIGVPKCASFDVLCASYVEEGLKEEARNYKIDDFTTLFSIDEENSVEKIRKVRKSLSEDRPVVIAMHLPSSFMHAGSNWDGQDTDVDPSKHGYHAMCVIGYDDYKDGGSFQIMNSWGSTWGDKGFVWVRYDDFAKYVDQAYEVYVKKAEQLKPGPAPKKYNIDGEMRIASHNGAITMPVAYSESDDMPHYITPETYLSGSKFRLYINNRKPAWVYVIASDLENNVSKLFPYEDIISAYMNYSENNFALPDEEHEFEFDATAGLDYFCVLYSEEELDINNIVKQIKLSGGSFYQQLKTVLGDKIVPQSEVKYNQKNMGFSATSNRTIVPLVVEIPHRDISVE